MRNLISTIMLVAMMATPALAEPTLQDILSANNVDGIQGILVSGPSFPNSSVNTATDALADSVDSYWAIDGAGGALSTIVVEVAGSSGVNTFGIYEMGNPGNTVQLFSGVQSQGAQSVVSILADGSVYVNFADTGVDFASAGNCFGYYLGTPPQPQTINFSDTSLNGDGIDHMLAFQGLGVDTIQIPPYAPGLWDVDEYILAWENQTGGGDMDYQDFIVIVESVSTKASTQIPAPGAVLLGSIGVSLVGWLRRRRSL